MYLLDTNVISELRVPRRASPSVVAWARYVESNLLFISVVSLMEAQYGALLLQHRDKAAGEVFRRWITDKVIIDFAERTLPVTSDIAMVCAGLHVPDRRGERDAWIAATALVHDMIIVTRNTRDFEHTGVRLLNPWDAGEQSTK